MASWSWIVSKEASRPLKTPSGPPLDHLSRRAGSVALSATRPRHHPCLTAVWDLTFKLQPSLPTPFGSAEVVCHRYVIVTSSLRHWTAGDAVGHPAGVG
eukprot:6411015-Pyramimonas_sp.AAC.1